MFRKLLTSYRFVAVYVVDKLAAVSFLFLLTFLEVYLYLFCSFGVKTLGTQQARGATGIAPFHVGCGDRQPWGDTCACLWWWLSAARECPELLRMSHRILSLVTTAVTVHQATLVWLCVVRFEPMFFHYVLECGMFIPWLELFTFSCWGHTCNRFSIVQPGFPLTVLGLGRCVLPPSASVSSLQKFA